MYTEFELWNKAAGCIEDCFDTYEEASDVREELLMNYGCNCEIVERHRACETEDDEAPSYLQGY
jgi:hypothetical protein